MQAQHNQRRVYATKSVALIPCALFALSWPVAQTFAQTAEESSTTAAQQPSTSPAAQEIDDSTIDKFAAAYLEVSAIQTQAAEQLKTTSDPDKVKAVQAAAESKAIEAVQQKGLAPSDFNRIAQLMSSDEQLRSRVLEKVQKRARG